MAEGKTIGIVGGGQLGRMLTLAAKPLGFNVVVLDASKNCPAGQVGAQVIQGDLYDAKALQALAKQVDVVTVEIEHLNTEALAQIAKTGKPVHPAPSTIALIQDKYKQKVLLQSHGVAVAPFLDIPDMQAARNALSFAGKMILKTKHGAYDGRGNAVVRDQAELEAAWQHLNDKALYAESLVPFEKELSVIIARDVNGLVKLYDVVETHHERNICLEVAAPAQISKVATAAAIKLATQASQVLEGAGVFAIEMFLLKDQSVLVNEIAPRVHNSGHHTIEAAVTSQFEQHIRAVTGLPLGGTRLRSAAVMVNILGRSDKAPNLEVSNALIQEGVHLHWYGKTPVKVDRKMGHVTALHDTVEVARKNANKAREALNV